MVAGELATVPARGIRLSAGLMVQTTIMALLGRAPAAVIGVTAILVEARLNRVDTRFALNNALVVAVLGVLGGVMVEVSSTRRRYASSALRRRCAQPSLRSGPLSRYV
jgi:hypothetical protein